ncbi:MAG: TIGR02646 family protein [Muribaculaceae bacterium]|nr:TIGR02646 family protein [Muribaculaceae bacterium]
MKTINKTEANDCLRTAANNAWSWDDFHKNDQPGYNACREQGLTEQLNECAYTGLWLGEGTKQSVHIDHFRKKALYPELTFDWNNLFVAAKDLNCGADYKDKHISGLRTVTDNIYRDIFSPLEANLSQYFWYRQDGAIVPHQSITDETIRSKVNNTIEIFNLNSSDLKNRRLGIIQLMKDIHDLDDETIRDCMKSYGFSFVVDFELQRRND